MKKKALLLAGCLVLLTGCGNDAPAIQVTTQKETVAQATEAAAEKPTEKATEATLSPREAKNEDVITGAKLVTAFTATLADEKAFDEYYPYAGKECVTLVPDGNHISFYYPEGVKWDNFLKTLDDNISEVPHFHYSTSTIKPDSWFLSTDENLTVYCYIVTEDGQSFEIQPNIDPAYK